MSNSTKPCFGDAFRGQEKAPDAARSSIGGIGSETENASGLKSLAVTKSHDAYRQQEKAPGGLHGGEKGSGSALQSPTVSRGGAYAAQSKASDSGSEIRQPATEGLQGETGAYLGHFRQDKFIRQGHNSDGYVPLGPSAGSYASDQGKAKRGVEVKSKEASPEMDRLDLRTGKVKAGARPKPTPRQDNDD